MVCYMMVSPNPDNGGWAVVDGQRGFWAKFRDGPVSRYVTNREPWVKFGDGQFRAAYQTANPDNHGVENRNHTNDAIYASSVTGRGIRAKMKVRLRKALEWEYLQCWSIVHSQREWHFLPVNTALSLEQFRQKLRETMELFPSLVITQDMDMNSGPSTLQFATIMEELRRRGYA